MRFILSVALKYLIPKWRQLSVSIISIVSVLVISLVVWLAIVFLSVSEGVQNKWIGQLLALNAPVRITPTEAYYDSYYYKADGISGSSDYTPKSIGEKLDSPFADPYDPTVDAEPPARFPLPHRNDRGEVIDIVKETWQAIEEIPGVHPREFETALGNLRLNLVHHVPGQGIEETCLSQISYFTHTDPENKAFEKLVLPPSPEDISRMLAALPSQALFAFFDSFAIQSVSTSSDEVPLLASLYPDEGELRGCAVVKNGEVIKIVIPSKASKLDALKNRYEAQGLSVTESVLHFRQGHLQEDYLFLTLDHAIDFKASVVPESFHSAYSYKDVELTLSGELQGLPIQGRAPMRYFDLRKTTAMADSPFWAYKSQIPVDSLLGDGIVISKSYLNNGVRLGDSGYLSYFAQTSSSQQEQRIPVYVAGFYDPGLVAMGNKFVFVDPKVTASLRGALTIADTNLGNGINVWLDNVNDARGLAQIIKEKLELRGVSQYWIVESFHDFEFVRPILQQLQSDQTLFTLVAVIILLVACSNIISMLILLVNDKRKEIGVMLAMGATRGRIASIFGICGFVMGLLSSVVGSIFAFFTIRHIDVLVRILDVFQGHDVFQAAFYGSSLPNEVSWDAISLVMLATLLLSLLAGLIPAIKASRVNPTETLRAE